MATMGLRARCLAMLFACIGLVSFGCNGATANSEQCLPGDFETVGLADGGSGFLRCGNEGGAYSPYDGPNPNVLPDASAADAAACGANGALLGYFCSGCTTNSNCASGLDCTPFPNKGGNICTPECTSANASAVCVPPSAGCGNNGHCKP